MQQNKKIYLLSVLIIAVTYFVACTPQKSHKVLSFLFDGVPDVNYTEANTSKDLVNILDSTKVLAVASGAAQTLMVLHSPYQEKKCELCHNQGSMGKTIEAQPKLCYNCHDDFEESYKFVHGPVGGGYCTSCHSPHKAKVKKLLLREGQQLCIHCHDSTLVFNNKFHKKIEKTDCTECHNPHGGENRYMPQHGSCYKCHDDFTKQFSYIHGPVAGEYCTTCHSPHVTQTKNLLLRQGKQLCLDCHSESLIFENKNHKDVDKNCIDCHNPHGGENRLFTKLN